MPRLPSTASFVFSSHSVAVSLSAASAGAGACGGNTARAAARLHRFRPPCLPLAAFTCWQPPGRGARVRAAFCLCPRPLVYAKKPHAGPLRHLPLGLRGTSPTGRLPRSAYCRCLNRPVLYLLSCLWRDFLFISRLATWLRQLCLLRQNGGRWRDAGHLRHCISLLAAADGSGANGGAFCQRGATTQLGSRRIANCSPTAGVLPYLPSAAAGGSGGRRQSGDGARARLSCRQFHLPA